MAPCYSYIPAGVRFPEGLEDAAAVQPQACMYSTLTNILFQLAVDETRSGKRGDSTLL